MRMLLRTFTLLLVATTAAFCAAAGTECKKLASVTIKSAAMRAEGQPIRGFPQGGDPLPAFCRVKAVARLQVSASNQQDSNQAC
jgi:hypothetical protein